MIELATAAAAMAIAWGSQAAPADPPQTGWTWTLYVDQGPIVLAHEIPDTPHLRTVLECEPDRSVVQLTFYDEAGGQGMARVSAGGATAVTEAAAGGGGGTRVTVPADHPAFAAFSAEGELSVAIGDQRRTLRVPAPHLPKLRRFAELCSA
jgi:hypothetical protein